MNRASFPPVLRGALTWFVPIGAGLSLVLVPMATLYEHSRRETLQTRLDAMLEASELEVDQVFREALGDSAVVVAQPVVQEMLSSPRPTETERRRVLGLFDSVVRQYERDPSIWLYSRSGTALLGIDRYPAAQGRALSAAQLPSEARAAAARLRPGQVWLSAVLWPGPPSSPGMKAAEPCVLLLRPLFDRSGARQGVLAFVIHLGALVRDFNRITKGPGALERGFLLSWNGADINTPSDGSAKPFAARYPEVWRVMLQRGRGAVATSSGLFLFRAVHPTGGTAVAAAEAGIGRGLRLVVQVPPASLSRSSAFAQPVGISLLLLLYLFAAATSVAIAYAQERQHLLRQQEQAEHERQQRVMDHAGVGMAICDPITGRIRSVNGALCELVGRTEAELRETRWQDLSSDPQDRRLDQARAVQLRKGQIEHSRTRRQFLSGDGTIRSGDQFVSLTRDAQGHPLDVVVQIIDTTELVTKTAYLEAASSAGIVGVWDFDIRGNRLTWDSVMYRLYGLEPDKPPITYDLWEQAVHPDDRASVVRRLQESLEGGQPLDIQFRVVWPDRSEHHIQARGRIQFDRDGQAQRMIGVNYDITEQVRRSTYIEAAAAAGIIGVWDWDIVNDELSWDPVMYALYGPREQDFAGTRDAWTRAVHPGDQPFVLQELNAAQRGWREYRPQFRVVWPDGSVHHVQARSRTTFSRDGRAVRMIGVNYDVTAQVERQAELDEQRALLAATMEALIDPLLLLNSSLAITELNPAAAAFFGRSQAQLFGKSLEFLVPAASADGPLHQALEQVIESGDPFLVDDSLLLASAAMPDRYVDLRAMRIPSGVVLNFSDVGARHTAAARLAESEEVYRLLAQNATDVVVRLRGDINLWTSPSLTEMLGWLQQEWVGHRTQEFLHPEDLEAYRDAIELIERGQRVVARGRLCSRDGAWHWVEAHAGPYRNQQGCIDGQVASFRIIDKEVAAERQLEGQARTDELTGLLNRREVLQRLDRLTAPEQRRGQQTALLFCDIDRFKEINDHYGHGAGDQTLRTLAERIRDCLRQEDLAARMGGDELVVILLGVQNLENAVAIAEKIRSAAQQPILTPAGEVQVSLSIGVTLVEAGEDCDSLIARADAGMYEAKRVGRNRVVPIAPDPATRQSLDSRSGAASET